MAAKHPRYKRVVLKLTGELNRSNGKPISETAIITAAEEIKCAYDLGVQIAIVLGGGNIFRGRDLNGAQYIKRATRDYMGMLATEINGLPFCDVLQGLGVEARLMSALETPKIAEPYLQKRAIRHLEKGRVVIRIGGNGVPAFTTDATAILLAHDIGAEAVLKGTKVNGIYDRDPMIDGDAIFLPKISKAEYLERGLGVIEEKSLHLNDEKIPLHIFNIFKRGELKNLLSGVEVGSEIIF